MHDEFPRRSVAVELDAARASALVTETLGQPNRSCVARFYIQHDGSECGQYAS
jgi:hypothetical protein